MNKIKVLTTVWLLFTANVSSAEGPVCDQCLDEAYVIANGYASEDECLNANCLEVPLNTSSIYLIVIGLGIVFLAFHFDFQRTRFIKRDTLSGLN
jgi:hypothetical protein